MTELKKLLRAKFHGIRVTDANLDYQGSITLDPEYCKLLGICPLEFVEIWNKNNGQRISTYVIFGEKGSKCCILNGSAARTCQIGDELIIASYHFQALEGVENLNPKILIFNNDNTLKEILTYVVKKNGDEYTFAIERLNAV
ncbi:MAG: aspartate 1-decarboxylase [Alphaproteobacteria bacterium]